jgi:hypothetical protein
MKHVGFFFLVIALSTCSKTEEDINFLSTYSGETDYKQWEEYTTNYYDYYSVLIQDTSYADTLEVIRENDSLTFFPGLYASTYYYPFSAHGTELTVNEGFSQINIRLFKDSLAYFSVGASGFNATTFSFKGVIKQ